MKGAYGRRWEHDVHTKTRFLTPLPCSLASNLAIPLPVLDLSAVGGFNPPLVPLNPQVFIDPQKNSQKYIADPPLVLPQIEYCPSPKCGRPDFIKKIECNSVL